MKAVYGQLPGEKMKKMAQKMLSVVALMIL